MNNKLIWTILVVLFVGTLYNGYNITKLDGSLKGLQTLVFITNPEVQDMVLQYNKYSGIKDPENKTYLQHRALKGKIDHWLGEAERIKNATAEAR